MFYPLFLLPFQNLVIFLLRDAGVGVGGEDGGFRAGGGGGGEGCEGFIEVERGGGGAAGGAGVVRGCWGEWVSWVGDGGGEGEERRGGGREGRYVWWIFSIWLFLPCWLVVWVGDGLWSGGGGGGGGGGCELR